MTSSTYNKYFVKVGVGTNRKLRRLPVPERWAYVAGLLSLAAQSPIRGALLIHDGEPVTAKDLAEECTIPIRAARTALESFRSLGMIERDEAGIEWVHDWDQLNPDPKPSDSPEATRARKRKQRETEKQASGHADVTPKSRAMSRPGHAMSRREVEVEGKNNNNPPNPPNPPNSGGAVTDDLDEARERLRLLPPPKPVSSRKTDIAEYSDQFEQWAQTHFPGCQTSAIEGLVGWVRSRGEDPTPTALREFAAAAPNFAHVLEPAA